MKLYRFKIKPQGPWSGSLRSDTLYGLICWYVAEREGEAAVVELIRAFEAGSPPFVLSSALPAGHLPMPCLPPIGREAFRKIAAKLAAPGQKAELALFDALQKFKKFRKKPLLPLQAWLENRDSLSAEKLFLWELANSQESREKFSESGYVPHVSIDRATGTAREGQLLFSRQNFFAAEARLDLYARTDDPAFLREYLELIGKAGFGADASTGAGQFEVKEDADFDGAAFENSAAKGNAARLLLSTCSAPDMRRLTGFYKLEVKRGKTGPGYGNPFKKPFLLLAEGAVLQDELPGPFVLRDINADKKVVQILQPLELPCWLDQNAD